MNHVFFREIIVSELSRQLGRIKEGPTFFRIKGILMKEEEPNDVLEMLVMFRI